MILLLLVDRDSVADGETALEMAWQLGFVDERHGEILGGHVADRAVRGHEQLVTADPEAAGSFPGGYPARRGTEICPAPI
jgi:hypothetical protein